VAVVERVEIGRDVTVAVRVWEGSCGSARSEAARTFVYLNGLESHSLWASELGEMLSRRGHRFVALDRRGSGANRDLRGNADDWIGDVIRTCEVERQCNGQRPLHLMAQCFGARLAIAAVLRRPDLADSLVLLSPGLQMRVDLTVAEKLLVGLGQALRLPIRLRSPITDDHMFTNDPPTLRFIGADPLRLKRVRACDFYAGHVLLRRIRRAAQPLRLPCLALFTEGDRLVNVPGTIAMLRELFAEHLKVHSLSEADHLLLFGRSAQQALDLILNDAA